MDVDNNRNWREWIYFNGNIIGADKFGNLNLGYVGTKMGYSKHYLSEILILLDKFSLGIYWEDSKDTEMILYGIEMANKGE
jgi:hypothetical protein